MKIYYPDRTQDILHISRAGKIYQLDSFWKMYALYKKLSEKYAGDVEVVSVSEASEKDFLKFHTTDFVKALMNGINREAFIESCGVFWQPVLPMAMSNRVSATIKGLLDIYENNQDLSILIADGGHHTPPFQAFGFGPINAVGVGIFSLLEKYKELKIAILDLDVHQGNGFSYIQSPNVKIFDLWNKKLEKWPYLKSNLNYTNIFIEKRDAYFPALNDVLSQIVDYNPDFVVYYSGVDVLETDRMDGIPGFVYGDLEVREHQVFETLRGANIKTFLTIGGGYVDYTIPDNIEANREKLLNTHLVTIESAIKAYN